MDDIREIKADIKELLKSSAVHNELLRTHEARSLALQSAIENQQKEIDPLKEHVTLMNKLLKLLGAVTVGATVQWAIRFLT